MRKLLVKVWIKYGEFHPEIWREDHSLPSYRYAGYHLLGVIYYPEFDLFRI